MRLEKKAKQVSVHQNSEADRPKIYVAAPFFSEAESRYNVGVGEILAPYFDVFLPQESGILMSELIRGGMTVKEASSRVYETDISAIENSDVILIILNGRAIDEGAAFELGYAMALGKRCFGLQTDSRFAHAWGNNPMIAAPLEQIFTSLAELGAWASHFRRAVQPNR